MLTRVEVDQLLNALTGGNIPSVGSTIVFTIDGWTFTAKQTSPTIPADYTGIDNAQVGTVYAKVADLNTLKSTLNDVLTILKNLGFST